MSKLIDREETIIYDGFEHQFTLYWGKRCEKWRFVWNASEYGWNNQMA